jgi:hypothetical protein
MKDKHYLIGRQQTLDRNEEKVLTTQMKACSRQAGMPLP